MVKSIFLCLSLLTTSVPAENWPVWRGPRSDGRSTETKIPIKWENPVWKSAVPGVGHASPIVWEDKIFTVSCLPETQERVVLCFSTQDGKMLWKQAIITSPLERKHALNSHASSTPATDGNQVYVSFLDVNEMVVAAYDLKGANKWKVRPGEFRSMHGFSSSPLLYKNLVLVNGDHDGDSYLVALDNSTGKTVWKTPRQNKTRSYCAPIIRTIGGRTQMILTGDKTVTSYDPQTGKLLWIIDGPTEQFVASPVYSETTGLVYITGGYPDHHILAIDPKGSGNVTKSHIVWRTTKGVSYVPSPIIEGNYFLIVSDQGFGTCFDSQTGKIQWQERLGEHHASLVSAAGIVYFLNDDGKMHAIKPGPDYQLIASSEVSERCFASPAISNGKVFVRGEKNLFCFSAK
jgi:outer membrane protein assembly factor BamB